MKLIELEPSWHNEGTHVVFNCPKCKAHRIYISLKDGAYVWQKTGETFEDLTLSPSIAHENHRTLDDGGHEVCKSHFFIKNGEIEMA